MHSSRVYLGALTPWSIGGLPVSQRPSGSMWSGVDNLVRGTWRPPSFVVKLLSGKRDQSDRGDLTSLGDESRRVPEETWWPRSDTLD